MLFNKTSATVENLPPVVYHDELILTTFQLAEFYETATDNIIKNFQRNRDRFVEGKHFYKVTGKDLDGLKRTNCPLRIPENVRGLYLWTKRGAARHAKSLNTNRAWDVFELLEDSYFNRTDNTETKSFDPKQAELNLRRGIELRKLSSHTRNPVLREELVAEAAKLIRGDF